MYMYLYINICIINCYISGRIMATCLESCLACHHFFPFFRAISSITVVDLDRYVWSGQTIDMSSWGLDDSGCGIGLHLLVLPENLFLYITYLSMSSLGRNRHQTWKERNRHQTWKEDGEKEKKSYNVLMSGNLLLYYKKKTTKMIKLVLALILPEDRTLCTSWFLDVRQAGLLYIIKTQEPDDSGRGRYATMIHEFVDMLIYDFEHKSYDCELSI